MGLFDWIGDAASKIVSPLLGTVSGAVLPVAQAVSGTTAVQAQTSLQENVSTAKIESDERMFEKQLALEKEKLAVLPQIMAAQSTAQAGPTGYPSIQVTGEGKGMSTPVIIGIGLAAFLLLRKGRLKL